MPYTFLSDDWLAEIEKLRAEAGDAATEGAPDITVNIVVTGGPDGDKEVHMSGGQFGTGLTEGAPTKLTVPFDVAKAVFVEQNPQAAMQAFMSGQIKVEGDMTKLMAMQSQQPSDAQKAMAEKIKEITAP